MNVFKLLLKQMRRLHYFVHYPDIIGEAPDAIEDPFRREYIKEIQRRMMNGELIPDIIRVRHTEGYPAVEVNIRTGRTRVTMEEILGSEKIMGHLRDMEAMMDRIDKERERREKVQAGEGNGRLGRKRQAGEGNGGVRSKSRAGEGNGGVRSKSRAGEGSGRLGRKRQAGEGNGGVRSKSRAGEGSGRVGRPKKKANTG